MYFPFLRGRQNELLALRELLEAELLSDKIIPIIEPVKLTATYKITMELFKEKNKKLFTIINPEVGDYLLNQKGHPIFSDEFNYKYDAILLGNMDNFNKFDVLRNSDQFIEVLKDEDEVANLHIITECGLIPKYVLITNSRLKREVKHESEFVSLSDPFDKQDRNVDYSLNTDKFFSNDHIYYDKEGYSGYSDYSIIGEPFIDGGFAPRSVAIHIVYFDKSNNLRIKHFVSDSNDDISNPAGKFAEALKKLVVWFYENELEINKTNSLEEFINLHKDMRYPGLGYVKKLSIKHHLELMSRFFESGGV